MQNLRIRTYTGKCYYPLWIFFSSLGRLCFSRHWDLRFRHLKRWLNRDSNDSYLWMHCYLMMTFTDFINDTHIYVFLFWFFFFQPFDDFEACFYAAVGEFRIEYDCHAHQTEIPSILERQVWTQVLYCIYIFCKRSVAVIWLLTCADTLKAFKKTPKASVLLVYFDLLSFRQSTNSWDLSL